jgi:hypothetical protein
MEVNPNVAYCLFKSEVRQDDLAPHEISASDWNNDGTSMWLITAEDTEKMIDAGWRFSESRSQYDGMKNLNVAIRPQPQVEEAPEMVTFNREYRKRHSKDHLIAAITEHILPHTEKVVVHMGRMATRTALQTGFQVVIGGSAVDGSRNLPGRIYFNDQPYQYHGEESLYGGIWEGGYPVVDGRGNELGAVDGNNLFIYYDIAHCDCEDSSHIVDGVFRAAGEALALVKEGATRESLYTATSEAKYVEYVSQRIQKERDQCRDVVINSERRINQYQTELVEAIREKESAERQIRYFDTIDKEVGTKYNDEYKDLTNIAHIESVYVRDETLYAKTDMIEFIDPRTKLKHQAGRYVITIAMNSGQVSFRNQSWCVGEMHAPHVFSSGQPCLGNMGTVLPELVSRYDFPAALMVIVNFLSEVNVHDSAGVKCHRWPLAPESAEGFDKGINHNRINVIGNDPVHATYEREDANELIREGGYDVEDDEQEEREGWYDDE